jgi:hypothetical protein
MNYNHYVSAQRLRPSRLAVGVWPISAPVSTTFRVAYAADPVRHLTLSILPG